MSQEIGYLRGEAVSLVNLGMAHGLVGKGALSLNFFEAALVLIPVLSEERGEAISELNVAGISHRLVGDDERALKLATKASVFFRSIGDMRLEVLCLDTLAGIDLRRGRRSKAKKMLTEVANRKEIVDEPWSELQVLIALCEVHLSFEDFTSVLACSERALDSCKGLNMLGTAPTLLFIKSLALAKLGRTDEARTTVEEAELHVSPYQWYAHLTAWRAAEAYGCLGDNERREENIKLAYRWLSTNLEGLTHTQQIMSWKKIPEHAAIREAYQRLVPITERQRFPKSVEIDSAEKDEIDVDLTISEPADWQIEDESERRQHRLVRIHEEARGQGASPRAHDLADLLEVSERTIKRDLLTLRSAGSLD